MATIGMAGRTLLAIWIICLPYLPGDALARETVIYSWAESRAQDERGHYPVALLTLALQKAGGTYDPHPAKHDLTQDRTLRHVELQRELDITWTLTTPEREARLLPIRIPIDRGLLGWRLLLINKSDVNFFAGINSAQQIKQLLAGQEQDWPDYKILLHNNFKVTPTTNYEGLFLMLKRGRIRYFPRAATEILPEIHAHPQLPMAIAPRWALYYPAPVYFFVNKQRPELAAAIEKGLLIAIADGSMQTLFNQHFSEHITQLDLQHRELILLDNPLLSADTPLDNAALWYSPARGF